MNIENLGVGKRCEEALRLLVRADSDGQIPAPISRLLLLPIPTSRDKVHLSGRSEFLSDVYDGVRKGDAVAGYGIDGQSLEKMTSRGALVYDALRDEEFLAENSRLTALGALGYLLTKTDRSPTDTVYAIVGYGRIGARLARMLLYLGGRVKVYTRRKETLLELCECGVEAHLFNNELKFEKGCCDLLINTAPTDLSFAFPEQRLPSGMRAIELASGDNFKEIPDVERLPSIPDKQYGSSAGRAYYNGIIRFITEATK